VIDGVTHRPDSRPSPGGVLRRTLSEYAAAEIDGGLCFSLYREMRDPEVVARFTIEGEPVSKQRAGRSGTGRSYTPAKTRDTEERVAWAFRQAAGPQQLTADLGFGVFAGFFCQSGQRRDVDNMTKLVLDGLTGIAWLDDSQVTEISAKVVRWDPDPRTEVVVYRAPLIQHPSQQCPQCGRNFEIYPSSRPRTFCSQACRTASTRIELTCPRCGVVFRVKQRAVAMGQRHCSTVCKRAAQADALIHKSCATCGKSFTCRPSEAARRKYCSKACLDHRPRSNVAT